MFLIVLIMSVVGFAMFRWKRRRFYELAEKIGGEKTMPIVGNLFNYVGDTEFIMEALKKTSYYSLQNGGISSVWFGPKLFFVVTDPVDAEYILTNCLEKDEIHRFFRELVGNGLVFAPVPMWKARRKIQNPGFSLRMADNFVKVFSEQSDILQKKMKNKRTVDLWTYCSAFTLDSVAETIMGTKIGAQTEDYAPFLESLNEILYTACKRMFRVWLQSDIIFKFVSKFTKYQYHRSVVTDFVDSVVKNKREEMKNKEDAKAVEYEDFYLEEKPHKMKTILDSLIEHSAKTRSYNDLELREEILTVAVAGTDTSAVAMTFTILLLAKHPDVQEKVFQELKEIYGKSDRLPVKEDLKKMVYLERMIKESMRTYPPVPFIARNINKEITLPSGKVLPAGSGATLSIFGMHRNKKYWGEDAEIFDPDRFSPERFKLEHPSAYMPFSTVPRNCLGYLYAMHSMKISISTILRKYKVFVPEAERSKKIRTQVGVIMKGVKGYEVQLEERIY